MDAIGGTGLGPALSSGTFGERALDAAGPSSLVSRQEGFKSIVARAVRDPRKPREAQAREAAEQFVAMSFVQPLLKQLRETNQAAEPFAPSGGEKQFQAMLDAQVAQQIVHASRFGLVDAVAGRLLARGGRGARAGDNL